MPSTRSGLPTLSTNAFDDWSWFLKLTVGGAYGTKRYTDQARNAVDGFTGNIDGTSQTWVERDLRVPEVKQNSQGLRQAQYCELDNLDYELGTIAADVGLKGVPWELWVAYFLDDGVTLDGTPFMIAAGACDDSTHKDRSRVTLKPTSTSWARLALGSPSSSICPYIFKDADTCQYAGADTVCNKTRYDCDTNKGNVAHFGGNDLSLAAGQSVIWQYMKIDLGGAGPSTSSTPPPAAVPPEPVQPPPVPGPRWNPPIVKVPTTPGPRWNPPVIPPQTPAPTPPTNPGPGDPDDDRGRHQY